MEFLSLCDEHLEVNNQTIVEAELATLILQVETVESRHKQALLEASSLSAIVETSFRELKAAEGKERSVGAP